MSLSNIERNQIKSYLHDYLSKRIPNFKIGKKMFTCPICKELSANIFPPQSNQVFCFGKCKKLGDIFDLARLIDFEGNKDVMDDDVAKELKKEFKINTADDTEKLLAFYSTLGWDLVPVSKNSKASDVEKEWTKKTHKDLNEWRQWLASGLNFGMKTGQISNVICIDFDFVEKKVKDKIYEGKGTEKDIEIAKEQWTKGFATVKEKLTCLDWTTIQQKSFGGLHIFVAYDEEIPKTCFEWEGIHVDILANGGQVVIAPSIVGGQIRQITGEEVKPLSKELKEWILSNRGVEKVKDIPLTAEPDLVSFDGDKIKGLEGKCNTTFIKILGQFRKFMPLENVEKAAYLVNQQMLDDPMDNKTIRTMCQQIEKYHVADVGIIGDKIIEHLRIVDTAHTRDLKECLGFDRKDLEQALSTLIEHKKILKIKKDLYKLIQDVEWQEDFLSLGKPLNYNVPYFNDYAIFDSGSMIIIGASSGIGKTTMSVNIIKKFVEQNIQPYLISTEAGSKFQKIAQAVGLKEGDFKYFITTDPTSVNIKPNSVTILDWLKPSDSDYSKFDAIYEKLNNQLVEKGGVLFVLAQLKKETNNFYAENMTLFYGALVAKLMYEQVNGVLDNAKPYLETVKIRESKVNKQYLTIPLKYDYNTKLLEMR